MSTRNLLRILSWIGWTLVTTPCWSDQASYFETYVRPLLVEHCDACHGEKKQQGGLRLDSRAGWVVGGDSGTALLPGDPTASLLIRAVSYQDADLQMPPDGKLEERDLRILTEWIRQGAFDPRESPVKTEVKRVPLEEGGQHWAFRPLIGARPPHVSRPPHDSQGDGPTSPIDRFVFSQMQTQGISPSLDADRYTWLRRVSLDITGLPPTESEIAQFIDDDSNGAFDRVVDRLLASQGFGERWGRHWLDLVGYADQLGTVNDVPAPYAWRYRDYVIRSFNADKPWDQFVREQIAGDLLPATSIEASQDALTATGFLLLGEIHIVTSDKAQLKADVVDQQIQKIGIAFLGQTLGCVRCHDHKFDPIHLEDYYGLAGILHSSEATFMTNRGVWSSIRTTELPETTEELAARQVRVQAHAEQISALRMERETLARRLAEWSAAPGEGDAAEIERQKGECQAKIADIDRRLPHLEYITPVAPQVYAVCDADHPKDAHIHIRGNARAPGDLVRRGFVRVVSHANTESTESSVGPTGSKWSIIPEGESGRRQLANWLVHDAQHLLARVTVNRIWQKMFGQGIVPSVDYFGTRGDRPTHPELLDWLASELIQSRWSTKHLIRQIALSRTYRLSSVCDPVSLAKDPANRWLGRMNRRRLDAESLRDTILATSGRLLSNSRGPSLALHLPENVGGLDPKDVNPISFRTSTFPAEQWHYRTIFLPVVRSRAQPGPAELRNLFDFVPPTEMVGQRPSTSVATQALYLMNSEFIKDNATATADWILKQPAKDDAERLDRLTLHVLNRPISASEKQLAQEFFRIDSKPLEGDELRRAWILYCHALLSSNEFLFRL